MPVQFIIHTDGAAKGNPGPSGIGVVIYKKGEENGGQPLAAIAEFIGTATNNVAEYRALLRGLHEALLRGGDEIEVRTDSELMARQVAGIYKVKSPDLQPLHTEAVSLMAKFSSAKIVHVLRGGNALADQLANQGVDKGMNKSGAKPAQKPSATTPTTTFTVTVDDRTAGLISQIAAQEEKSETAVATQLLEWAAARRTKDRDAAFDKPDAKK